MGKLQKPMIFESKVSADPFERTVQLGNTAERLGAVAEEIEIISTMLKECRLSAQGDERFFPRERDKGDEGETSASADAPECRYSQQPSAELGLAVIKEYGTGDGITQGRMTSWPYSRNLRAALWASRANFGSKNSAVVPLFAGP